MVLKRRMKSLRFENAYQLDQMLIEHFYKPLRIADASLSYRFNYFIAAASTERHDRGTRLSVARSS